MKKALFATTAIVAASVAGAASAEGLTLKTTGWINAGVAFADNQIDFGPGAASAEDFHIIRDGEIHFTGSGTLDNGITLKARVELEAFTTGDQIDENYVQIGGSFGTIQIGGNDTAKVEIGGGAGNVCISPYGYSCYYDGASTLDSKAYLGLSGYNDSLSIAYYTPNFMGFQAGVSFTPDTSADGSTDGRANGADNGDDLFSIGAKYRGDFGDASVGISGGWADADDGLSDVWHIGADVGFSGFSVGVIFQDLGAAEEWAVGASYSTGPWSIGGGYARNNNGGPGSTEQAQFGVAYALGPGVSAYAGIEYGDANVAGDDEIGGLTYISVSF